MGAAWCAPCQPRAARWAAYQATEVLAQLSAFELQDVTVALVRVNGEQSPRGAVLKIGEVRIEVSTALSWDASPPDRPGPCYC